MAINELSAVLDVRLASIGVNYINSKQSYHDMFYILSHFHKDTDHFALVVFS